MAQRRKPMTRAEYDRFQQALELALALVVEVGEIGGRAFGVTFLDRALATRNKIAQLRQKLADGYETQITMRDR